MRRELGLRLARRAAGAIHALVFERLVELFISM